MDRPDDAVGLEQVEIAAILGAAQAAAHAAGRFLMERLGGVIVREKNPRDLVTEADHGSQEILQRMLLERFPGHSFLGEEGPPAAIPSGGDCWVVDPLDGTMNFVHQLPSFSVSVGFIRDGQPAAGVVHDPWLGETWVAGRGYGAFLNQCPIRPGTCAELDRALLVSSFPSTVTAGSPELIRFNRVVQRATMRRLGSAALNLCYVASGRLDGYWASTLSVWDVAAGIVIAQEAGARVSHLSGRPFNLNDPQILVTGTPELHGQLLPLLEIGAE